MRAVAYLRVSTDDQSTGLEVQRAACEEWAAREGAEVASWHVDRGASGGLMPEDRPGLWGALDALEKGSILLVHKRDRLARDVVVAGMAERIVAKAGCTIQCADGNGNGSGPESDLLRGIIDVFAQYERAMIRFRTKAALARKKSDRRKWTKTAPYGYQWGPGRELLEHPEEARAVELAKSMRGEGATLRAIGEGLDAAGFKPRGKAWHPDTIKRILEYTPPAAGPPTSSPAHT